MPVRKPATSKIDTPAKRARLPQRRQPWWAPCGTQRGGLSLGYRRAASGPGAWIARLIDEGARLEHRIGQADDPGADGAALSYGAATAAALAWAAHERGARTERAAEPPVTVRAAIDAYTAARTRRAAASGRDAKYRLAAHLLTSTLADRPLAKLTETELRNWVKERPGLSSAGLARLLADVRACLRRAADAHHRTLPAGFLETVRRGLQQDAPPVSEATASHHRAVLTDADIRRIVEAAFQVDETGDFGRLVAVLAGTGARFSQSARLRVADALAGEAPRIMVPTSRKGRIGSLGKPSHVAVPVAADLINTLTAATRGRAGADALLERWRLRQVAPHKWERERRGPWQHGTEMARLWSRALVLAGIADGITPYRLRDASIIRGLRAGLPVRLVAQLHDTSTVMIERAYASHIADALGDVARRAVVSLAPAPVAPVRAVS